MDALPVPADRKCMAPFTDMVAHVRREAASRAASTKAELIAKRGALAARMGALGGSHTDDLRREALALQLTALDAQLTAADDVVHATERAVAVATDLVNRRHGDPDTLALELASVLAGRPLVVPVSDDLCPACAVGLGLTHDSQLACPVCGYAVPYLDATAAAMAYGSDVEYSSFMYKRIGHLRKHMDNYQGKVRTVVPPEVMRAVMRAVTDVLMTKFDVEVTADVELWMVRPALKELDRLQKERRKAEGRQDDVNCVNYRELYKYYTQVYCELTGRRPPHFEPRQEQHIYMLFKALQVPFEMYKPPERKNFLNYTYVMFKCCQKLGYADHLRNFSLMKDGDKLKKVDALMRRIFEYNNWEWMPTPTAPRKKR